MSQNRSFRFLLSFVAGFLSVLFLHQGVLALLNNVGFIQLPPYSTNPTPPFGLPQVFSSAVWGGLWGIVVSLFAFRIKQTSRYWIATLLFGAVAPTMVALFVVLPLKGLSIQDWPPNLLPTGLMVNAAWAAGVASVFRWVSKREDTVDV